MSWVVSICFWKVVGTFPYNFVSGCCFAVKSISQLSMWFSSRIFSQSLRLLKRIQQIATIFLQRQSYLIFLLDFISGSSLWFICRYSINGRSIRTHNWFIPWRIESIERLQLFQDGTLLFFIICRRSNKNLSFSMILMLGFMMLRKGRVVSSWRSFRLRW